MKVEETLSEIKEPTLTGRLSNNDILLGPQIPAIDRLKIVSSEGFEDIIREWLIGYKASQYIKIRKSGGAGDMGRDVIAYITDDGKWDNYQCKHYDHPLAPSDIYIEIGKLCYYSHIGNFILPENYYFVAPQGVGNKLGNLLDNPKQLKTEFLNQWDKTCKDNIKSKEEILLSEDFKSFIDKIVFSLFKFLDPQQLIEEHKETKYYAARFGGGLNKRPDPTPPPEIIDEKELRYVEQLYNAYEDNKKEKIRSFEILKNFNDLFEHFNRQRESFYWAEALNEFSRDQLPEGDKSFEDLKMEIFKGVIDIANSNYDNGYTRLNATTQEARKLSLTSNPLISVANTQDRSGICHHLANENKLIWVEGK